MKIPALPENEIERQQKLNETGLMYSPGEVRFDRITALCQKLFDVPMALVTLISEQCQWFKSSPGLDGAETERNVSFCAHAILHPDEPFIVPDTFTNPDFSDNPLVTGAPYIRFYAGCPLMYKGVPIGTLCLLDTKPRHFTPSDIDTLTSLAKWAESEVRLSGLSEAQNELITQLQEAQREAMIDPLTRLWNRAGMDELLGREMNRAMRHQQSLSIMMIDVDNFKTINDTHGHPAGDAVIKEVAQRIRLSVRPSDVVVRYGGDEFFVLATDCPFFDGMRLAERIHERVKHSPVHAKGTDINVNLTIGLTSGVANDAFDITKAISSADSALYEAKQAGRGRVVFKGI